LQGIGVRLQSLLLGFLPILGMLGKHTMNRKPYQGPVNDKEKSKRRLIEAVGAVIRDKGYTGLTATNISKAAGLDRRLITLYFGTIETLIETYVRGNDFWIQAADSAAQTLNAEPREPIQYLINSVLQNQLDYFLHDEEMQKIVLWQISQSTKIMSEVCEAREQVGHPFFALADQELKGQDVDHRAVTALLVAGIYHLVLYSKSTACTMCEIDLHTPEGMGRIKKAISVVLNCAFTSK